LKNFSINNPSVFDQIPNLLSLELISCSTSNSNLLHNLTNLEQLTLENKNRTEFNAKIVPQTLKFLYLKCQNLYDELHTGIFRNLPNLISLRIDSDIYTNIHEQCESFYNDELFPGLSSLRKLELGGTRIPWTCLSHLINLSELSICNWQGLVDFGAIQRLSNLKSLKLRACNICELPPNVFVDAYKHLEQFFLTRIPLSS
jgi:hypothetical protein